MYKPTMHWSATLTALALTMTAPAFGQASTGDPFLDAMMQTELGRSHSLTTSTQKLLKDTKITTDTFQQLVRVYSMKEQ